MTLREHVGRRESSIKMATAGVSLRVVGSVAAAHAGGAERGEDSNIGTFYNACLLTLLRNGRPRTSKPGRSLCLCDGALSHGEHCARTSRGSSVRRPSRQRFPSVNACTRILTPTDFPLRSAAYSTARNARRKFDDTVPLLRTLPTFCG